MSAREQGPPDVAVEVRRGSPSDEELAALLAVVPAAYAAEPEVAPAPPVRSRWELSARGLRTPLAREAGWRGYVA